MSERVRIYRVNDGEEAVAQEWHLASSSPSFLRPVLGRAYRRRRLLSRAVNWDRVLFAEVDGEVAGYLQFYQDGKGPHQPSLALHHTEYGIWGGAWRWALYRLLDWRFRRGEAYLYRIIVLPPYRGSGLGRQLLAAWLERLDKLGEQRASLEVWGSNTQARAFYASLGFEVARCYRLPKGSPG